MSHKIVYEKWTFPADKIREGNLYLATSLLSSSLEVNTLSATVECDDPSILDFQRNAQLLYYAQPDRPMVFRVQSVLRVAPTLYELSCTSTLGLLTEGQHMGGIYTGQTAQEVIADICGTVPFIVKTNLVDTKLYGWLPIASPRDNLSQVLFAIGAALKTDLDGILRIEGLWNCISSTAGSDRMYTDAAVDYDGKVTQVIVTEHQYVPWTEEKQLFEGTAQQGDIITFTEPMHSLTATGFTLLDSGANWAKVSAGSGTLMGKSYIHNTRQIKKDVFQALDPNVKTVKDATLVSLVNSHACAQRLAEYYKCREQVDAPVVYKGELPGDLVATYHPFDKVGVSACLESADITLSNTIKAQEKSLVGFKPTQIEEIVTYEYREVLTGNGEFTIPIGVTSIVAILIGGGSDGGNGSSGSSSILVSAQHPGEKTKYYEWSKGSTYTDTVSVSGYSDSIPSGQGGMGGIAGKPGKIFRVDLEVTPLSKIQYNCGSVGAAGEDGGETTFGDFSSESGEISPIGYKDPITDETFAVPGKAGMQGENGGSIDSSYALNTSEAKDFKTSKILFNPSISGEPTTSIAVNSVLNASSSCAGAGSGGAGGRSGDDRVGKSGWNPSFPTNTNIRFSNASAYAPKPRPGQGGRGADGGSGATYGSGGHGGGGGGSAGSLATCSITLNANSTITCHGTWSPDDYNDSIAVEYGAYSTGGMWVNGGDGGTGGKGAPGCVIIYYGYERKIASGQFVDKNGKSFLEKFARRFIV